MSPHDLHPHSDLQAAARKPESPDALDDNEADAEPTIPNTTQDAELLEAIEWLRRAGVVSDERPPFSRFFDELAENTDTGTRRPASEDKKQVG